MNLALTSYWSFESYPILLWMMEGWFEQGWAKSFCWLTERFTENPGIHQSWNTHRSRANPWKQKIVSVSSNVSSDFLCFDFVFHQIFPKVWQKQDLIVSYLYYYHHSCAIAKATLSLGQLAPVIVDWEVRTCHDYWETVCL